MTDGTFNVSEMVRSSWQYSLGNYVLNCSHQEKPHGTHTLVVTENGKELERQVLVDDDLHLVQNYRRLEVLDARLRDKYYPRFFQVLVDKRREP